MKFFVDQAIDFLFYHTIWQFFISRDLLGRFLSTLYLYSSWSLEESICSNSGATGSLDDGFDATKKYFVTTLKKIEKIKIFKF